jgi:hypothetical protein
MRKEETVTIGLLRRAAHGEAYRASWAIIRQWTGYDAAIVQKEAQIQRLERLVLGAICALQRGGLDDAINRLHRVLPRSRGSSSPF